jgi:hypothetical protein
MEYSMLRDEDMNKAQDEGKRKKEEKKKHRL